MKKFVILVLVAMVGLSAYAQMDTRDFSASLVTTNVGTQSFTLRGEVEGINVVIPAGKTCTVAIATSQQTLFSKADMTAASDGFFAVRIPTHTTAGVAITAVDNGSNTNSLYGKAAAAGSVTATFTPAAATTGTNTYTATVIYKK